MDMEEDIKILEEMIEEYKNCSVPGLNMRVDIGFREKQCNALEHIISDYKKLQEEFRQVDHECSRLENKEVRLEKEIAKLKELMKYKIFYTKELEKDLFENASNYVVSKETIKDKLEQLKVECDKMRPYRDASPHDFGYINGKIDMLAELLKDDEE